MEQMQHLMYELAGAMFGPGWLREGSCSKKKIAGEVD